MIYGADKTSFDLVANAIKNKAGIKKKIIFPQEWVDEINQIQAKENDGYTLSASAVVVPINNHQNGNSVYTTNNHYICETQVVNT